jgi:hypothetical protein
MTPCQITKNSFPNDRTTKVIVTKQNRKKLTKVAEILEIFEEKPNSNF